MSTHFLSIDRCLSHVIFQLNSDCQTIILSLWYLDGMIVKGAGNTQTAVISLHWWLMTILATVPRHHGIHFSATQRSSEVAPWHFCFLIWFHVSHTVFIYIHLSPGFVHICGDGHGRSRMRPVYLCEGRSNLSRCLQNNVSFFFFLRAIKRLSFGNHTVSGFLHLLRMAPFLSFESQSKDACKSGYGLVLVERQ